MSAARETTEAGWADARKRIEQALREATQGDRAEYVAALGVLASNTPGGGKARTHLRGLIPDIDVEELRLMSMFAAIYAREVKS